MYSISFDSLNLYIHQLLIIFVIFGALNYSFIAFGYNFIEMRNNEADAYFNRKTYFNIILYFLIVISGIILIFKPTIWNPSIGPCNFPSKFLVPNKVNPIGTTTIKVDVTPNTRVAYWSSLPPNNHKQYEEEAYGDYSNSGVVTSDINGRAELLIVPGSKYFTTFGKINMEHVHYRELDHKMGMIGELKTVYY